MQEFKFKVVLIVFLLSICSSVFAVSNQVSRLSDDAEILSSSERRAINSQLDQIARDHQIDLFIVTIKNERELQPPNLRRFARNYFNTNKQLSGSNGAVLALSMNPRKYEVETFGSTRIMHDRLGNRYARSLESYLRRDSYGQAFHYFAEQMLPPSATPFIVRLFSAAFSGPGLLIPFFLTLIITVFLAWNHKGKITVDSNTYASPGSFRLMSSQDNYIRTKTKTRRINRGSRGGRSGGGRSGGASGRF